jgi:8-amino-7-oxononanoate synthase
VTPGIAELAARLDARAARGLARTRRTLESPQGAHVTIDGRDVISFASNDYLGLANDPRLAAAASAGLRDWGIGAGASHLAGGHQAPHAALESALAAFCPPCEGARAITFATGYLANLAILTALADRQTTLFADRLNHACLNDGALLARARFVRYPHGDAAALAARMEAAGAGPKLIATDAVFSMDGDEAPLPALLALAERHDAWLVVDDAHGFGVLGDGRGSVAGAGLRSERIIYMATLGKAAGVAGAFVCAHPAVIETIIQTARPYIYTTAAPVLLSCALLESLAILRDDSARRAHLFANIDRLRAGASGLPWTLLPSGTAIQPLRVGEVQATLALSTALWESGIYVPAIRPPTVPEGTARLRISLSAAHTGDDIDALLAALRSTA